MADQRGAGLTKNALFFCVLRETYLPRMLQTMPIDMNERCTVSIRMVVVRENCTRELVDTSRLRSPLISRMQHVGADMPTLSSASRKASVFPLPERENVWLRIATDGANLFHVQF